MSNLDLSWWYNTDLVCPDCNNKTLVASPECKTTDPCIHGVVCTTPNCKYVGQARGSHIDAPEDNPCYPFFWSSAEVWQARDKACKRCGGRRTRYLFGGTYTGPVPCPECRKEQYNQWLKNRREKLLLSDPTPPQDQYGKILGLTNFPDRKTKDE